MGTLILVRHATTDASASARNLGRGTDLPLSEAGHALADALGRTLAQELSELPHDELRLVSSPALRCRQTIAAVARSVGVPEERVELDAGLLEIDYGAWDGLTADECRDRDPELRRRWEADPYETRCPDGESGRDVEARSAPVLGSVDAWLGADRARCAIVVAHNHVNRLRLCRLFGWPMAAYRDRVVQDPGGYSIVGMGGRIPVVRRVNASAAMEPRDGEPASGTDSA
jgi:broad specificity phosphatase PhoE